MPEHKPIEVNDQDFEEKVLHAELPVIVDFWAPWCGPCRMVAPLLEKVADEHGGELIVAKVNTDDNPTWAMHYGVQGIPTMLFIHHGELISEQVGAVPEEFLNKLVDEFLSNASVSVE